MTRKRITILGATGSIGMSALSVVAQHPDRFEVVGLVAGSNDRKLLELAHTFRPKYLALLDAPAAKRLAHAVPDPAMRVLAGPEGLAEVAATPVDLVIAAIVGGAGLLPTFAAMRAGNPIALANKETLVMAGPLFMEEAKALGVRVLPVDSEHSAIFQCLAGNRRSDVDHILLTASGGPFRTTPLARMAAITPEEAVRHPNWNMGAKITIDSATMMNKGLEVIEARWLFGLTPDQVRVVVHPQSIVHSMVAFRDGSVMAQLGVPDMQTPIAYAMTCPERIPLKVPPLDFARLGTLSFEAPDSARFPCLALAYEATRACGTVPTVLNAANEVAVARFLEGRIGFMDIPRTVERIMAAHQGAPLESVEQVLEVDGWARRMADEHTGIRA